MKQAVFILSLISFSFNQAYSAPPDSKPGQVSGIVTDKDLKEALPYVSIIINDMDGKFISGNSTGEDGSFTIKDIPAGKYIFMAQFIGYNTFSMEIEISNNRSILEIGRIE